MLFTGEEIVAEFSQLGVTHAIWIPDNTLGKWEDALVASPEIELVRVCREGEAWPMAAGLIIGGQTPILIMQTTGLFESGDALRNIVFDLNIPIVAIIGARNWLNPDSRDTAKTYAEPILNAWGLDYRVVASVEDKSQISEFLQGCLNDRRSGVILLGE
jgi:sulfopyruvate decarboxylase TPP-binding subunit